MHCKRQSKVDLWKLSQRILTYVHFWRRRQTITSTSLEIRRKNHFIQFI